MIHTPIHIKKDLVNKQTLVPTSKPTIVPTLIPTMTPTYKPTMEPTFTSTVAPTFMPTVVPTFIPTAAPTFMPTMVPTLIPTMAPKLVPTMVPTSKPTMFPTLIPTMAPTAQSTILDELYEWVTYLSPYLMPLAIGISYTAYRIRSYTHQTAETVLGVDTFNDFQQIITTPWIDYYNGLYNDFSAMLDPYYGEDHPMIRTHEYYEILIAEADRLINDATETAANQNNNFYRDVYIQGAIIIAVTGVGVTIMLSIPSFFQQIFVESDNDGSPRRELYRVGNNKSAGYLRGENNVKGEISHYLRGTERFNINDSTKASIEFYSNKSNELEESSASELNSNAEISLIALNQTIGDNFTYM